MRTFFTNISQYDTSYLEKYFPKIKESSLSQEPLSDGNFAMIPTDVEVLIISHVCKLNKEVLKNFLDLKLIVTRSTGFDHLDTDYCKKHNIAVKNVSGYSSDSVAEFAIGLLIVLLRNIQQHIRTSLQSETLSVLPGHEVKNKSVGLIGYGRIGKALGSKLRTLGAKVQYFDESVGAGIFRSSAQIHSLESLLKTSDVVILSCSLNEKNRHMINKDTIKYLKNAYLVNIARGGLVETDCLLPAIKAGSIRAVALDVLEEEDEVLKNPNHKLWQDLLNRPEVVYSPHNAFFTEESLARLWSSVFELVK